MAGPGRFGSAWQAHQKRSHSIYLHLWRHFGWPDIPSTTYLPSRSNILIAIGFLICFGWKTNRFVLNDCYKQCIKLPARLSITPTLFFCVFPGPPVLNCFWLGLVKVLGQDSPRLNLYYLSLWLALFRSKTLLVENCDSRAWWISALLPTACPLNSNDFAPQAIRSHIYSLSIKDRKVHKRTKRWRTLKISKGPFSIRQHDTFCLILYCCHCCQFYGTKF